MIEKQKTNQSVDTRPRFSRRKLMRVGAGALAGAIVGRSILWEPHHPRIERVSISVSDLGRELNGYRIAVLSDFHIPFFVDESYITGCIDKASAHSPDLFLCVGDFCNSKGAFGLKQHVDVPNLEPYFRNIRAPDGVYGCLGNHDYWLNAAGVSNSLAATPVKLLHNTSVIIRKGESSLAIVGTPDLWEADIDLVSAFAGIPDDIPRIFMQHNPDLAEQFPAGYRVDLQVSGHTHGGQVCVPFGPALILPSRYGNKYREGLVQGPRHRVYITRGVGLSSTIPVRFCCPPEITILELVAS
jgi:predicted MPP superfamily phosphohydrolase